VADSNPFPSNPFQSVLEFLARLGSKVFLYGAVALFVLIGLMSSYYSVPADAVGIEMRFGRYVETTKPGLRFKIPYGIERVKIVPVERQQTLEFGFGTPGATNREQYAGRDEQSRERSMITGDKNAVTVEWVVQYRIDRPKDYLFLVRHPEDTLRHASESVMREMVGDRTVDEVLTVGRQEIEDRFLVKLQELVNLYGLGFRIDQVQLKNVNPPREVQASFNEVNQAQQEKSSTINNAHGQYNKAVPRARGEADRKIASAEGAASKRVNEAQGDAERFLALYKEYALAPDITRKRLYLERMQEVLPRLKRKVVIDEETQGVLPLLHLGGDANPNPALKK
jgi:membrane protease subunit HflK